MGEFHTRYDEAGRPTKLLRVSGTPDVPDRSMVQRLTNADFASGIGAGWSEGTRDGSSQWVPETGGPWGTASYAELPCAGAAPGRTGADLGLYYEGACSYATAPDDEHLLRQTVTTAKPSDVLQVTYWRQVREGVQDRDRFRVYVALSSGDDLSDLRIAYEADSDQASFATWRRTPPIRLRDLFTESEWPSGQTTSVEIVLGFAKGEGDPGTMAGIVVDEVSLRHVGEQTLVELAYDEDHCAGTDPPAMCLGGLGQTGAAAGRLTTRTRYLNGQPVSRERFVWDGPSGALSGYETWLDWRLAGDPGSETFWSDHGGTWTARYAWTDQGQLAEWIAPYRAGIDTPRHYALSWQRGALAGLRQSAPDGRDFIDPDLPAPGAVEYDAFGVRRIRFANNTQALLTRDSLGRLTQIEALDGGRVSWDSGVYAWDAAGQLVGIGAQSFRYDAVGRLVEATVEPSAGSPAQPETISYGFDPYGNMVSRQRTAGAGDPPQGFEFSGRSHDDANRVTGGGFAWDIAGRAVRMPGKLGASQPVGAGWTELGELAAFFEGDPALGGSPAEHYLYDARGLRVARFATGRDGHVTLSVRGPSGDVVAEYAVSPGESGPEVTLSREYLHGFGRLLVERQVATESATASSSATMHSAAGFHFDVAAGGATRFLAVRVMVDDTVDGSSVNQVELTTVSRIGNDRGSGPP